VRGPGPRRGDLLPFVRLPHRRGWRAATGRAYQRDQYGLERRPGSAVLGQEALGVYHRRDCRLRCHRVGRSRSRPPGVPQRRLRPRIFPQDIPPGYSPRIFPQDIPVRGVLRHVRGHLFVLYFTFAEATYGKTIGKAVMGLRVTADGGGRPNLGTSFLRNLSKINWVLLLLDVIWALRWRWDTRRSSATGSSGRASPRDRAPGPFWTAERAF
jgi:RDD family